MIHLSSARQRCSKPMNISRRIVAWTLLAASACSAAETITEEGPVTHYVFDSESRTTVEDKSGHGNLGKIVGPKFVHLGQDTVLRFDGVDDYLEIPDSPDNSDQSFAFEMWAKIDAAPATLVSRSYNDIRSSYLLQLSGGGHRCKFFCSVLDEDGTTEKSSSTRELNVLGMWTHLVLTHDGQYLRLYVNGVQETFVPTFDLLTREHSLIPFAAGKPLNLGRAYYAPDWSYFKGDIAEFRAYDRALESHDVKYAYRKGIGNLVTGLPKDDEYDWSVNQKDSGVASTRASREPMLDLVKGGEPVATIVTPIEAKYWTRMSAEWLQNYLKKITGAHLQIVSEDTAPQGTLISIGETELAKNAGISLDDLKWAGCKLVVKQGNLYLIGKEIKDVLQDPGKNVADGNCRAVVTFLEEFCGMRWYIPGPNGEFFSPLSNVRVPETLSKTVIPAFAFSDGRYIYGSPDGYDPQWLANITPAAVANNYCRNVYSTSGGHTYYGMVPTDKYFKDHPEYFALIDGKRTGRGNHLCTTNPEVRKLMLRWMEDQADEGLDVITLGQEDGYIRCQCDECEKLDHYRFRETGQNWRSFQDTILRDTPCERLFLTHQWVIDELAKSRPAVTVLLMGYAPQAWPSKVIDNWGDNVWVELANQEPEYIEAWRGKTGGMTTYLYWFNSTLNFAWNVDATPSEVATNIRHLYAKGVRGFYHTFDENYGFSGPTYYMMGKLMGDPHLDPEELVNEYIDGVYDKAAPAMKKFFDVLYKTHEARFPNATHGRSVPSWSTTENIYLLLYPPKTLAALEKHLASAEATADTHQAKGWVRLTRDFFDFTSLLTRAITAYRIYQADESPKNWYAMKETVEKFDAWRSKVVNYDLQYAKKWFPHHGHFCNWLTANNHHETPTYYTPWETRREAALKRGVIAVSIGYAGGLAGAVSGYSYIDKPLSLNFVDAPRHVHMRD